MDTRHAAVVNIKYKPLSFDIVTSTEQHLLTQKLDTKKCSESKMHSADRWKLAFGPAGTRNVARLSLLQMCEGLERNWIQFDCRFREYHAKMRELLTKVPKEQSTLSKPLAKALPIENTKVNDMEKMGKAIEKSLMNHQGNSEVNDIKKALVRAFAEGRPKQHGSNTNSKVMKESEVLTQAQQLVGQKFAVSKKSNLVETRVSHAAVKITDVDDHSVQSMEIEVPEKQQGNKKKQREYRKGPEQQTNTKVQESEFFIEKSKATEQTAIRSPLKRRHESCEEKQMTNLAKRLRSPKNTILPPNANCGRYINPVSVYGKYRIPKKAYRIPDAIAPSASPSTEMQIIRSGPSNMTSAKSPQSPEQATKKNDTLPSVDQQPEVKDTDDTSSTEIDESTDEKSSSNPASELQIKREMQDAITNPSTHDFNGMFVCFVL